MVNVSVTWRLSSALHCIGAARRGRVAVATAEQQTGAANMPLPLPFTARSLPIHASAPTSCISGALEASREAKRGAAVSRSSPLLPHVRGRRHSSGARASPTARLFSRPAPAPAALPPYPQLFSLRARCVPACLLHYSRVRPSCSATAHSPVHCSAAVLGHHQTRTHARTLGSHAYHTISDLCST